jgi:hypothetical protein
MNLRQTFNYGLARQNATFFSMKIRNADGFAGVRAIWDVKKFELPLKVSAKTWLW